ncbi:hypothetical protein IJG04_02985 [Candidatus Saccharibacteria bacterium]|nr:hypothetical protein [Candidatus Saccharibacteria bacterium]
MKRVCRKILLGLFVVVLAGCFAGGSNMVYADDGGTNGDTTLGSCRYLLGMTSWDCGVPTINNEAELTASVWIIASNILVDLTVLAAYLVVGYVIYGGYLYILSSGDPSKMAMGKKTLTQAFIGLAIVLLSNVILSTIRIALLGQGGMFATNCAIDGATCNTDATSLVTNLLQWVIGVGGIVAAIFVLIGGIGYVTSSGDPSKLQKAKTTIIYALIGLVIVALAEIITAFVSNLVREANTTSYIDSSQTIIIAKEYYEN